MLGARRVLWGAWHSLTPGLSPILSYVSVTLFSPFLSEEFSLNSGVALSRGVGQ